MMRYHLIRTVLLVTALAGSHLSAQELSSSEIRANLLAQINAFNHQGTRSIDHHATRSIVVSGQPVNYCQDTSCATGADEPAEIVPAPAPPTIRPLTVIVQFGYNSATVENTAQHNLVSIAATLGDPAANGHVFQVSGFTDSRGSAAYNLKLSARRAGSVVAALRRLGVPGDRMKPVGRGKTGLLPGIDPADGHNRRVEVLIVG